MFITELEDFDYKPYVVDGEIVRDEVVLENALLWDDGHNKIVVQAGFVSNLASLPPFTSLLFKKLGKHQRAAILHDWLYRKNTIGKKWSDTQFNKAMKQDGVRAWRRALIIAGLKIGGHKAWKFPTEVVIV